MNQEPEVIEGEIVEDEKEIGVMDVTDKDEETDPIPSSFVDRPLNSAPWQEGERPEPET